MTATRTRPIGYAEWNPSSDAIAVVGSVADVIRQYVGWLPISLRQTFYALVAAGKLEKDERAYARLGEVVNRARRAGLIPFEAIRDDGVTAVEPAYYSGTDDFRYRMLEQANGYRLDRQAGQDIFIEVWTEAAGTVPQIAQAVESYGVPVYSASGFLSLTAIHDAAQRAAYRDVPTVALQVGDHDPSGASIFDRLNRDVGAFAADECAQFTAHRVALTGEQVEALGIQTSPPKRTDSRSAAWTGETAQLEAVPPDLLTRMVHDAIVGMLDRTTWKEVCEREDDDRRALLDELEGR